MRQRHVGRPPQTGFCLLLLALFLCLGPVSGKAWAQRTGAEPLYAVSGVAADDVLNIRDRPGGKRIIDRIPPDGRGVAVLGPRARHEGGTWARVRYKDSSGWVNMRFLKPDALLTSSTRAVRETEETDARQFEGTWNHEHWTLTIDGKRAVFAPAPSLGQPSRTLASGSTDCGTLHERNFATVPAHEVTDTFTDPRFRSWVNAAGADTPVRVMVVTCGSSSRRYVFLLSTSASLLVAEWDKTSWLMCEEFHRGSHQVGR